MKNFARLKAEAAEELKQERQDKLEAATKAVIKEKIRKRVQWQSRIFKLFRRLLKWRKYGH